MLLSKVPPPDHLPSPVANPATAQRMFNDLALELTRSDAELTDAVYDGNRVGAGWDTWFKGAANRMLDAHEAYRTLLPGDREFAIRLRSSALDLAASGGQLYSAYMDGDTFGAGWDTTLDRKIDLVREAAGRVYGGGAAPYPAPPAPFPSPQPGVPGGTARQDAARAADLVRQSIDTIRTVPVTDRGDESSKGARIAAHGINLQAQQLIEQHFATADPAVGSQLRRADAHLEDANWQLARKPSPDGRFTGVDIAGALRDSEAAVDLLEQVASAAA